MSQKILVVDDEQSIVTLLKYNLETAGYIVEVAYDGEEALQKVNDVQPDLVVLDVMLPKLDGIEVCKTIRSDKNLVPILMLTAKDDEFDRVLGLELGADDYMTKPFSPREVVARVKAILRRSQQVQSVQEEENDNEDVIIGSIKIRPEYFEVYKNNELLELTPKEFELLLYLIERQGRVITREHMLNSVWNYEFTGDSRIVDVHISHLRDKLEENPKQPKLIKTVRGLGYKLERPKSAN
ncbi:response regulator transcription factor [Staphylococcus debuckii]|uniref:response regulator transcription factor n=1 Tax=Staphylococcus debuckii TaxID=2044912 RepID=UPI000F43182A|nr:response regulator transcription factor [Staphylococcus debuckii]AYU55455.1 DNA-binding response regulator [Staphylococcus debuckii]